MNSKELIDFINKTRDEGSRLIPDYNARAVNAAGMKGIAILTDNSNAVIDEKFNKVQIRNAVLQFDGKEERCILLSSNEKTLSEKYGQLCLDFISPSNLKTIQNNPLDWFEEWRTLLGDAKRHKMIYDVIAEMHCVLKLKELKKDPKWESTDAGTFDIICSDEIYEVKASTIKSATQVTIHNQFQLAVENLEVPLHLLFVRCEKNQTGESIDDLYKRLVEMGYSKKELDDYLDEIGYKEGKQERYVKYIVHELRDYLIDDNFPKISAESFKDGVIPNAILSYQYTVSLDGLEYKIM